MLSKRKIRRISHIKIQLRVLTWSKTPYSTELKTWVKEYNIQQGISTFQIAMSFICSKVGSLYFITVISSSERERENSTYCTQVIGNLIIWYPVLLMYNLCQKMIKITLRIKALAILIWKCRLIILASDSNLWKMLQRTKFLPSFNLVNWYTTLTIIKIASPKK